MLRLATSRAFTAVRTVAVSRVAAAGAPRAYSGHEMSDSEFDASWKAYFEDSSLDSLGIRMGLNKVFAADLIPNNAIVTAALTACRRANDFSTSVRVFEGLRDKAPNAAVYQDIVKQLAPTIAELGLSTPEELGLSK